MEDQRITAEDLLAQWQGDLRVLAQKMAAAINGAKFGRIIADSEEPVRDAQAVFRQQAYQKAMDLVSNQLAHEAISPSADPAPVRVEEQGQAEDLSPDGQRAGGGGAKHLLEQRARHGRAAGSGAGHRGRKLQRRGSGDGLPPVS